MMIKMQFHVWSPPLLSAAFSAKTKQQSSQRLCKVTDNKLDTRRKTEFYPRFAAM